MEEEFEEGSDDDIEKDQQIIVKAAEIEEVFFCQYCDIQLSVKNYFEACIEKHLKKGSPDLMKCSVCDYSCKRKGTLKKHINTKHPNICPICGESFKTEAKVEIHFKERQMNRIDNNKHQRLSALINNEAKESVLESKTESLTTEELDNLLDKYESKMDQFDEFENSDIDI